MSIKGDLVLPADVVLVPVAELPAPIREQLEYDEGDYAVTRLRSRTPSSIINAQAAALLNEFRTPKTIVQAIIHYSQESHTDPEQTLAEAFPMLQGFMASHLLVPADSEEANEVQTSLEVGQEVSGFEVIRCVQIFEDTEIYQVRHPNGVEAALKILRPNIGPQGTPLLDREAAILRHLDGCVSPRLLKTGEHEGRSFLLIEWCFGISAEGAAAELRRMPGVEGRKQLLNLCRTIAAAYARLHAQNVVHADVHPNNVLVDGEGAVKIIDYGFARLDGDNGEAGEPPRGGVAFFFEPEYAQAWRAHRVPTAASRAGEQYAVTGLLYLLLTGAYYLDFSLENQEMMRQIAEESMLPFARRGVRPWPEVEAILTRALSKNPAERFASMAEFAEGLQQVVVAEEPEEPATSRPSEAMQAAGAFLDEVLRRVGPSGPLFADGLTTAPTCSLNFGMAGIAYALYRIACARDDATLLSLADVWATRALAQRESSTAFYNAETELLPETVGQISPYHTTSGIYAVQALLGHARGDVIVQQLAGDAFVAASRQPCRNLDLTLGRASTLIGASLLLDALPDSPLINDRSLRELGDSVMRGLWEEIEAFAPIRECGALSNLGIAHGWAGLLYATLRWCQASGSVLPGSVEERLDQLAECAEPIGRGVQWKWFMNPQDRSASSYMPGWCNGSAGFVFLWTLAHGKFGREAHLALARKATWNTWEEPDSVHHLCCGLAGRAYGLLNLFKHTGDKEWLHRARELTFHAVTAPKGPDAPVDSLYKGDIGVAILIAELSRPETACMPFFEPEGWPLRPAAVSS